MNRKGIAVLPIVLIALGFLLIVYIVMGLSPNFLVQRIKSMVDYIGLVGLFVALQVGIIYIYYRAGKYINIGLRFYHQKVLKWGMTQKYRYR